MRTVSILAYTYLYVYGNLLGIGGTFGYPKIRLPPLLVIGCVSFLMLLFTGYGLTPGKAWALMLAAALALALSAFFSLRYAQS